MSALALRVQKDWLINSLLGVTTMRKVLGALLLCCAAACNSSDSTDPGTSVTGDYVLRSANGVNVPGVASQDASGTYEVLKGRIVLRSDLSFVDSLSDRFTPPGAGTTQPRIDVRQGFYTQTGNNITLTFQTGSGLVRYAVTVVDARTLAYSEPDLSLIYSR
jgi:hypothetical protein